MNEYGSTWAPTLLPTSPSLRGAGPGGPALPTLALPSAPLQTYWESEFRPGTPQVRRRVPVFRTLMAVVVSACVMAVPAAVTGVAMAQLKGATSTPAQNLPGFRPPPPPPVAPVACCQSAK